MQYMETLFDTYGVEHEDHSDMTWILHPGDHMRIGYFPGLGDDSMTVTFDRQQALQREDFAFLSWEHPMVAEAMDMVMNSETGNSFVTTIEMDGIEPGTVLLETFSAIRAVAPKQLQLERYLPLSPVRTLISKDRKNYAKALSHEKLNQLSMKINRQTALAIIKQLKKDLDVMIDFAMRFTGSQLPKAKQQAARYAEQLLTTEIHRLKSLQGHNPSIRDEEIAFLEEQLQACLAIIDEAKYELQAVRLIIVQ